MPTKARLRLARKIATITLTCVERLFAWLRWFRRLVTRNEYHIKNYLGMVRLGCMRIIVSDYSYRSATMGSTFAARRAGT